MTEGNFFVNHLKNAGTPIASSKSNEYNSQII